MAFLLCQCRCLIKDASGKIIHLAESKSEFRGNHLSDMECYCFVPCPVAMQQQLQQDLNSFICNDKIIIFNPYTIQHECLNQQQFPLWIQLVEYIHQYVQSKLERPINLNNIEEVHEAYYSYLKTGNTR
jgi:hypothetical protein